MHKREALLMERFASVGLSLQLAQTGTFLLMSATQVCFGHVLRIGSRVVVNHDLQPLSVGHVNLLHPGGLRPPPLPVQSILLRRRVRARQARRQLAGGPALA